MLKGLVLMKKMWVVVSIALLVLVVSGFFAVSRNNETADSMPHPAPWPTPTSTIDYNTDPSNVFTFMCELSDQYQPDTFYSACADGYAGIRDIKWSTWSAKGATGSGYRFANPCDPDCASDSSQNIEKVFLKLDTPIQMGSKVYLTHLHSVIAMADGGIPGTPQWDDWDLGYDFRMMRNWGS